MEERPRHPLWLSVLLSLFPGIALGAFVVGSAPLLQRHDIDPVFALFGGIGIVIVPLELATLAFAARRATGVWSPLAVVDYKTRMPLRRLLPMAAGLALWFIVTLIAWSALAESLMVAWMAPWLPETIMKFAQVESGGTPSTAMIIAFVVVAFVFNGIVGPVTEELYFRGYLLPRMEQHGRWTPILSTLLFAIYHVWTPWRWLQIVIGFLPLTIAVRRTRSIYVSMAAHVIINVVFLTMLAASLLAN